VQKQCLRVGMERRAFQFTETTTSRPRLARNPMLNSGAIALVLPVESARALAAKVCASGLINVLTARCFLDELMLSSVRAAGGEQSSYC